MITKPREYPAKNTRPVSRRSRKAPSFIRGDYESNQSCSIEFSPDRGFDSTRRLQRQHGAGRQGEPSRQGQPLGPERDREDGGAGRYGNQRDSSSTQFGSARDGYL